MILACGHSARDVFELLSRRGFHLERKTFAMGGAHRASAAHRRPGPVRRGGGPSGARGGAVQARCPSARRALGPSRSACVPAERWLPPPRRRGGVVTNGASESARAGRNANAALLVNVNPVDLPGSSPLAGVELQRTCERAALCGGRRRLQRAGAAPRRFYGRKAEHGTGLRASHLPLGRRLDGARPRAAAVYRRRLAGRASRFSNGAFAGFTAPDAVLTGVESRSSSPVTVVRDRTCAAEGAPGIYPCGEGAGYAGGIMSAATDGIRCAEALIASLRPR